jgi:hypothetical protein
MKSPLIRAMSSMCFRVGLLASYLSGLQKPLGKLFPETSQVSNIPPAMLCSVSTFNRGPLPCWTRKSGCFHQGTTHHLALSSKLPSYPDGEPSSGSTEASSVGILFVPDQLGCSWPCHDAMLALHYRPRPRLRLDGATNQSSQLHPFLGRRKRNEELSSLLSNITPPWSY